MRKENVADAEMRGGLRSPGGTNGQDELRNSFGDDLEEDDMEAELRDFKRV